MAAWQGYRVFRCGCQGAAGSKIEGNTIEKRAAEIYIEREREGEGHRQRERAIPRAAEQSAASRE